MNVNSSGNQTPEVIEQNLLMQKIFNLSDPYEVNRTHTKQPI